MYAMQAPGAAYMQPAGGIRISQSLYAGPPAKGPPPPSEAEVCSLLDGPDHTFIVFNGHGELSACCGLCRVATQPLSPVHVFPRPPGWTAEGNAPSLLGPSDELSAEANGGVYPGRPCPQDSPLGKLALNAFMLCPDSMPPHFVGRVDGAAWTALLAAVNTVATSPRGSDRNGNISLISAQLSRVAQQHAAALGAQVQLSLQELPFQTWFRGWPNAPPPSIYAAAEWVVATLLVIRVQLPQRSGAPPPPRELQLPNVPGAHPALRSPAFVKVSTHYSGPYSIAWDYNRRCVNIR